jgi:hypothetical protein
MFLSVPMSFEIWLGTHIFEMLVAHNRRIRRRVRFSFLGFCKIA